MCRLATNIYVWCALAVTVGALVILLVFGQSNAPLLGGDGITYNQIALNLVQHGSYSSAASPPYYDNVMRMPGYPVFLALFHLIDMHSLLLVRIVQFAFVVLMAGLVYRTAVQVTSVLAARISALLCATYLPFLWLATFHLTEVLASVLLTLLVYLLVRAIGRPVSAWHWVCVGLILGAGTYLRPEIAILGILVAVAVLLTGRRIYPMRSWSASAIILMTMTLALTPWTVRNTVVAGTFVPFTATGGSSLYASAKQYEGTLSYKLPREEWHRFSVRLNSFFAPLVAEGYDARAQIDVDNMLKRRAQSIFSQLSFSTVMANMPARIGYLWGTADFTAGGQPWSIAAHRIAQLQYGFLALFVLVGVALRRRKLLREWPLWLPAAYLTTLHLVFPIEGRYTLPARPMLLVYAGFAMTVVTSYIVRSATRRARRGLHHT